MPGDNIDFQIYRVENLHKCYSRTLVVSCKNKIRYVAQLNISIYTVMHKNIRTTIKHHNVLKKSNYVHTFVNDSIYLLLGPGQC